jgi:hypothetical protein
MPLSADDKAVNVASWPIREVPARPIEVRSMGHSGLDLLTLSFSHFDRAAKLAAIPAGASPANIRRSSQCCSYIQQRRG